MLHSLPKREESGNVDIVPPRIQVGPLRAPQPQQTHQGQHSRAPHAALRHFAVAETLNRPQSRPLGRTVPFRGHASRAGGCLEVHAFWGYIDFQADAGALPPHCAGPTNLFNASDPKMVISVHALEVADAPGQGRFFMVLRGTADHQRDVNGFMGARGDGHVLCRLNGTEASGGWRRWRY